MLLNKEECTCSEWLSIYLLLFDQNKSNGFASKSNVQQQISFPICYKLFLQYTNIWNALNEKYKTFFELFLRLVQSFLYQFHRKFIYLDFTVLISHFHRLQIGSSTMKDEYNFQEFAYSPQDSVTIKTVQCKFLKDEDQTIKSTKIKKLPQENIESYTEQQQVLRKIVEWRKINEAPVDTMGCERLADPTAPLQIQKYQTLISLMLSIQTKDETTSMCVNRLKKYGLTPISMANIPQQKLIKMIYECNFNKRKAKNIIAVSNMILKQGLARNKEELMKYPGVGVKIAMIYMNVAEGQQEGIGVDTHVHRICNRLGWVKTEEPNQTQKQLQLKFRAKFWKEMNIALVGFGQLICSAKKPLCSQCPVRASCPSSSLKW